MRTEGFRFAKMHELKASDLELDLHNDYDFLGFESDMERKTLTLNWQRTEGEWVRESLPLAIEVEIRNFVRMKFRPAADSSALTGSQTLSFIGHLHPEEWDEMDGCLDDEHPPSDHDFIVGFEDGAAVKVRGGIAEIRLSGNALSK